MNESQRNILKQLEQSPLTGEELVEHTGYSPNGIRGRISELRKLGYDIQYEERTEIKKIKVKKYVLKSKKTDEFLTYLKKRALFGKVIDVSVVAKQIGMTVEEIQSIIGKLFLNPNYSVIQLSNVQVKIQRLS